MSSDAYISPSEDKQMIHAEIGIGSGMTSSDPVKDGQTGRQAGRRDR